MKFQILSAPDGSSDSLIEEGAATGDGTKMIDFMRDFDGSELAYSFEVPPPTDPLYAGEDVFPLTEGNARVIAGQIHRGFMEGRFTAELEYIEWLRGLVQRTLLSDGADSGDLINALQEIDERIGREPEEDEEDDS